MPTFACRLFADREDLAEGDFAADFHVELLDFHNVAGFDFQLLAAGLDNRVHFILLLIVVSKFTHSITYIRLIYPRFIILQAGFAADS